MMKYLAIAVFFVLPAATFAAGPTITLFGGSSITLSPGFSYVEPGYSAFDTTDGDLTSSVAVSNGVNVNQPGHYSVGYSVTDSLGLSDSQVRSVTIGSWGSIANPCTTNGTCPCPINYESNPIGWKQCVVREYPKLIDGSTLVCRLKVLQPGEHIQCAQDQAGFGEMVIARDGTETYR